MKSHTSERFRRAFKALPPRIQREARAAYKLFSGNPGHPGLHFKRVHPTQLIYSVRISRDYRALAAREADTLIWFWIGSHDDYEKLLSQLRAD